MLEEATIRILRESFRSLSTASPPVNNGNNISEVFWSARSMKSARQSTGVLRRLSKSFLKNENTAIPEPASTSMGQVSAQETAANQGQGRQKGSGVCHFEVCKGQAREHQVGLSNSKWNAIIL